MRSSRWPAVFLAIAAALVAVLTLGGTRRASADEKNQTRNDKQIAEHAEDAVERGRQIFRFDTFGDEDFWGGALKLHQGIEGAKFGGVGPGVSPRTALAVGLKVDSD